LRDCQESERRAASQERGRLRLKLKSLRERIASEVGEGESESLDGSSRSGVLDSPLARSREVSESTIRSVSRTSKAGHHAKRTRVELQRQLTALQQVPFSDQTLPHSSPLLLLLLLLLSSSLSVKWSKGFKRGTIRSNL
jgi:hypothetical protein